jgi:hypothetical protein
LTPAIHVGLESDDRKRGPTRKPRFAVHLVRVDPAFDAHVHRSVTVAVTIVCHRPQGGRHRAHGARPLRALVPAPRSRAEVRDSPVGQIGPRRAWPAPRTPGFDPRALREHPAGDTCWSHRHGPRGE